MEGPKELRLDARADQHQQWRRWRLPWLRRRPRNRRFKRRHVLDVKLRASQRRHNRLRRLTLALLVASSLFFILVVVWRGGEELLRRGIYENPAFALHHLEVQTDGAISIEQIRRWAGVKLNDNLFALDLGRIKRDLELVPSIASASVERLLPHTLRIRVIEREPIAQVVVPPAAGREADGPIIYQLDASGFVMYPLEGFQLAVPALTNLPLPRLTGVPAGALRFGRPAEWPQVHAALQLILALERSPMAGRVDLRQIDVSAPGALLVTTGQGTEVTFGLAKLDQQLRRWHAIDEHGQRTRKQLAWLDLSVANNVPVRWSPEPPSETPPALEKPLRYKKKKHV